MREPTTREPTTRAPFSGRNNLGNRIPLLYDGPRRKPISPMFENPGAYMDRQSPQPFGKTLLFAAAAGLDFDAATGAATASLSSAAALSHRSRAPNLEQ